MRRIAIFCDGTWNKPDQEDRGKRKPSNIVKLSRAVLPMDDQIAQIVFYDEGVGTGWGMDKLIGGGFGRGLSENIIEAYRFLILNYHPGDEIYLFGFSRGAYTVRSLAGFVDLVGLLPKDHAYYLPEAYAIYRNRESAERAARFREDHVCRTVSIRCIGVFDTVGALAGGNAFRFVTRGKYEFHNVKLVPCIEHAYHALAIDERRKPFRPAMWQGLSREGQTLEQRWFAGVHTNIGGGYARDGLANIALHWIKDRAQALGLQFDEEFLSPYRPFLKDELRDSKRGLMRFAGSYLRPIPGAENGHETIDPSAVKRLESVDDYQPENLIRYQQEHSPTEPDPGD